MLRIISHNQKYPGVTHPILILLGMLLFLGAKAQSGTEIDFAANTTNVAAITNDSLILITGSTYSFTVDTPEDAGLIATAISVDEIENQITAKDGSDQEYRIIDPTGAIKRKGGIETGDRLMVISKDRKSTKTYHVGLKRAALNGQLRLERDEITVGTRQDLTLYFTAGQRTPDATVKIEIPAGIKVTLDNTTVNVIGRGEVKLSELSTQSIGRTGSAYSYTKVGEVSIEPSGNGGSALVFRNLDLRPFNGFDLKITIGDVNLGETGDYSFRASYTTSEPEVLQSPGNGPETAILKVVPTIADFQRVVDRSLQYKETPTLYTSVRFKWTPRSAKEKVRLMQSMDRGKSWSVAPAIVDVKKGLVSVNNLEPDTLYTFRLETRLESTRGREKQFSNTAHFYSGKPDIKSFGVTGAGTSDDTDIINAAIDSLFRLGGGTLFFSDGVYNVRTVHLRSNVWLYVDEGATIKALRGADAPRPTWFSDKQYRSGLSPTAPGPYKNPDNWLTKQDVGHTYFVNTMFFGERLDNVKIMGNGRITGDGNLVTSDKVMNRVPDNRADKMFTFKLCTNIEIGGIYREEDIWYDPKADEPYYIRDGSKDFDVSNMLQLDQGGHFVLLATGTDHVNIHNTYLARHNGSNARDIYDFMQCNNVTVTNIYSKVSSDDIVKLGSDCSLGFTRPVSNYLVRNVIGDTNCNLFQIGSETADDVMDVHVDNIYVLGANKAGFSISTNDGGHVKDIHLNCGHTGSIHSRSEMYRTRAPFFISISNRARVLGATVGRYKFDENGTQHDELLANNVDIGQVENIILNGIDVYEVYGGSSYRDRENRWPAYDGSQNKATPIVAGYKLPDSDVVEGGLDFRLPNGEHTGYIKNIILDDVNVLVKGGYGISEINNKPPELGVGQYNVSNLGVQPAYGLWVRHAKDLKVRNCTFNYEQRDSRYALYLDDVLGAEISDVKVVRAKDNPHFTGIEDSKDVTIKSVTCYDDEWGGSPSELSGAYHENGTNQIGLTGE